MARQLLHDLGVHALFGEERQVGVSALVEGEVVKAVVAALERLPSRQRARLYALAVLDRNHGRLVGLLKVPLGAGLSLLSPRLVDTLGVLGLEPLGGEQPPWP